MTRRDFLCLLTALVLVPHAGLAQKRRLIATLALGPRASVGVLFDAFQQALRDLGYRDDNTVIEGRWADGDVERLPGLAAELVRLSPDVIVALSGIATPALKRATTTIPIVFAISDDPVGQGLVASLAHPGGNATGMSFAQEDTVGKQLQLLETMAPRCPARCGAH